MTRRSRILVIILAIVGLALTSLLVALSHDSPCPAPQPVASQTAQMKAVVSRCYGSPAALKLEQTAKPTPANNEVLVKVHVAAVNPLDWHYMRGKPYIMRLAAGFGTPNDKRVGVDFAGTVETVGKDVSRFKPGDEVFGGGGGALAQYVIVREDRAIALKPANVTFEQAAAVPIAAVTALQGLRDKGNIKAGQKVLINGASGGVGTFAVQIAKFFGAEVTGVCSTRNVELVRSIGADHVVDYTKENFTQGTQRYDMILDNVGSHSLSEYRQILKPTGALVIVGGPPGNPWIGPLAAPLKAGLLSPFVSQRMGMFLAKLNQQDLQKLADLMQAGKMTAVIDRRYPLDQAPEAIGYLETGRARGKVIVNVE